MERKTYDKEREQVLRQKTLSLLQFGLKIVDAAGRTAISCLIQDEPPCYTQKNPVR